MVKKFIMVATSTLLAVGVSVNLTACSPEHNTAGSTVTGAALGGVLGAAIFGGNSWAGIIGGALVGGIVGNQIGQSMDRRDAERAQAIYQSQSGRGSWTNRRTGYEYTIRPVKTYDRQGQYCREYQTTARIGGKVQNVYGHACRQPDGSWKVVS